jgi:hypothetical protein
MSSSEATDGHRRLPPAIPLAIGLAWAAALAAHVGGFAHRFHHDALVGDHGTFSVATWAGFSALWIVMVAAMMLASTVPLLRLFTEASSGQDIEERWSRVLSPATWLCGLCSVGWRSASTPPSIAPSTP